MSLQMGKGPTYLGLSFLDILDWRYLVERETLSPSLKSFGLEHFCQLDFYVQYMHLVVLCGPRAR